MIASILYIYFPELPNAYTQLNHNFRTSDPNISAPRIYLTVDLCISSQNYTLPPYTTQLQLPHIRPKYTCHFHISNGRFIRLLPRIAKRLYATQSQLPHIRPKYTCAFHISIGRFIRLLPRIAKRLYATQSHLPHIRPKYTCPFHISNGRFIRLLPRIAKRLFATQSHLPHIRPKYTCPFIYLTEDLSVYFLELPNAHTLLNRNFRTSDPNIHATFIYLTVDLCISSQNYTLPPYTTQSQLLHIRPKHRRPSHMSNDHTKTYKILNYSKNKI